MRKLFFVLSLVSCCGALQAQTAVDSVKGTVEKLFLAMKRSDAVLLKECFTDSAIMQTIARDKTGGAVVKTQPLAAFAAFIATLPKGSADERISFDMVKQEGALASVWTPYQFYMNGQFSHCGINSFQLVRTANGWKIQYIVDTRVKQGCAEVKQ
ncbi:hypothetical protein [Sediminibacterium soli]|uniref:hypothetical protein n=1 Tax=Sediminibacterium soli TaxID=2698829 RepID=UPI00137B8CC5|nr:hypothetical protein [Sediminibacterium soli]NCI46385.1 hypothetical protein [Sediminibacterium soli]